jgi:peptidoglycan/xylan/chitin deacetylase (PgdA/CDA1 family)
MAVRPAEFEAQIKALLRKRYRPASIEEVLGGRRLGLHVTFDDAFRSAVPALDILERIGVPATVFACTGYADDGAALLIPELASRTNGRPEVLLTMQWESLAQLADRDVEIGSHTVSHAHLTRLSDQELRDELCRSREQIEERLGRKCRYLAYPFGESDARVRTAARAAGYEAAFSLRPGPPEDSLFGWPRVDVYRRDGRIRFALKASRFRARAVNMRAKTGSAVDGA